jgi:hypothetical protein
MNQKVLWVKVRGRQTDWVEEKQEIQVMNHRDGKTPHRGVAAFTPLWYRTEKCN